MAQKYTQEEWQMFMTRNCLDSYSLATCLAILIIWESGAQNEEQAREVIKGMGLSGNQALTAMGFAFEKDTEEWLDEDMKKLLRSKHE